MSYPNFRNLESNKEIQFYIQGKKHTVKIDDDLSAETMLNEYLRKTLHLTGTKKMCYQGGCGTCVVAVKKPDPITGQPKLVAVNSCLVSILTCHGWQIDTIEGIGNPTTKFHVIQETLAKFNGTQCGFCSPGMVMNMYALYESKQGKVLMQEVEDSFSGNICRCTGYRPILSAFKSLCSDASSDLLGTCPDIEDCSVESCKMDKTICVGCPKTKPLCFTLGESKWIKVFFLKDALEALKNVDSSNYMLVAGNTAKGVYRRTQTPSTYIDIIEVKELLEHELTKDCVTLGANMSLTDTIELFRTVSKTDSQFKYLEQLAKHIDLVANVPVRNVGTLAGNLMIKHQHNDFPSDIFLILETAGAVLTIADTSGTKMVKSPNEFLSCNMDQKILLSVTLPGLDTSYEYQSYKIMPRAQNVHALVNAGFLFKFNAQQMIEKATVVIGHMTPTFVHAKNTEEYLIGKNIFDNSVLQGALKVLFEELEPDNIPAEASPKFRKQLAVALFYKAVLSMAPPDKLNPEVESGASILERPISNGTQDYETNKSLYPLGQPISKLEALAQTSGQAQYVDDLPELPHQLYAVLIVAKAPAGSIIKKINTSEALEMPGVIAFYERKDIPGLNNFMPPQFGYTVEEPIFCEGIVKYFNQPIGVLVAENEGLLRKASSLIKVVYDLPKAMPLISTKDILQTNARDKLIKISETQPKRKGADVDKVIKGTFNIDTQYHFHMETQCCNIVPTEDGLDMFASTQWMDLNQLAVANMLNIPNSKINVTVRRCGGGFGAKISRNSLIACATALPAWKLRRPVRMSLWLTENMSIIGKRYPFLANYEVGVDAKGTIQYMEIEMYTDIGNGTNEPPQENILSSFNVYLNDTYHITYYWAKTDVPTYCWTRAPGSAEGTACIETIMDHISHELNLDPLAVRLANLPQDTYINQLYNMTLGSYTKETKLMQYIADIKEWADVDKRKNKIDAFNQENRWKKKGISVIPLAYAFAAYGPINAHVSIFHGDGSVSISHGGIEIGQGINTKAAQVCAYKFGIPLEKVQIVPSNSSVCPNATATGGSMTSEAVCYAVIQACDELLERIKPYKQDNMTWEQLITICYAKFVSLSAEGLYSPTAPNVAPYIIYAACVAEVIVDVLTGQHIITRVDIIEDVGDSMSPEIDIGQVEGAFVMGIGYHMTENIIYDNLGNNLTNDTWTYWPPGAKDIPVDFRVKFPKNNPFPHGVLKSKAIGEPPICLSIAVPLAIRYAIASARADADKTQSRWYPIDGVSSVECNFMNCLNDYQLYSL